MTTIHCPTCGRDKPATKEFFRLHALKQQAVTSMCLACYEEEALANRPATSECPECHRVLPRTEKYFQRDTGTSDGLRRTCKDCRNAYRKGVYEEEAKDEDYRKHKAKKANDHYHAHRDEILERGHERNRRPEQIAKRQARDAKKREDPKEVEKIRLGAKVNRILRIARGEKDKAPTYQERKERQPELVAIQGAVDNANRKAKKLGVNGRITVKEFMQILEEQSYLCYFDHCKADIKGHVTLEHLLPFSRGGTNEPANIVGACEPCNYAKAGKTVEEFEAHLAFIEEVLQRHKEKVDA